ncbi:conserved hypothetical protein [Planktothrix serta PCC 8927]|uniref:KGK family protein n=1 Tax=Planktothrix serta PCC 8927 TaxID=671068 RepID=A0A7Z9E2Q8_9CYAN|nr:KGK domain-containing protein [Planktothrix serta]VXD20334.1 conserved hypothetical protein [Planktothrix serta PCC 8927]
MSDVVDSENCEDYEVLLFENHTSLVQKIKQNFESALKDSIQSIIISVSGQQSSDIFHIIVGGKYCNQQWFEEGKECKLLKLGAKEWQPGKVRIKVTLEFCPDELEEVEFQEEEKIDEMDKVAKSLDDIRQKLNQETK